MPDSELNFSSPLGRMLLCSEVKIAKPVRADSRLLVRWHRVNAIWDTGAVTSAVSRPVAEKMRLEILERAVLSTGAGMFPTFKDIVLLDLQLPDGGVIPAKVAVVDTVPGSSNDFLIGMDIIQCGDLSISTDHDNGMFNVRFRPYDGLFTPSSELFRK